MNQKVTIDMATKSAQNASKIISVPAAEGKAVTRAVIVRPVVNAVSILRYLSHTGAPERSADIARHLSINSSTCFNILRTLVAEDVVDFNPLSKTYSAGLGLARLVDQLVTRGQRIQLASPLMHDLAAKFGVTVTLWRRLGADRIVLVSSESSPTDLHITMPPGARLPILMGASGRLYTGRLGLTDEQIYEAFNQIRWARPISFETYLEEVNLARRRGWASDDGYFSTGVLAIAAPVSDQTGMIAFTVSAVMIRGDRDKSQVEAVGEAVRDLGQSLQSVLV